MSNDTNFTRSLRDQIKERRAELKELEAMSKKSREEKKGALSKTREVRITLLAQVQYILQERTEQAEVASALLDGLFSKRELTEEFKVFLELFHERRAALKEKFDKKKAALKDAKKVAV